MNTITAFCAADQKETAHELDLSPSGEIVLTCECDRFIKLPAGTDAAGIKSYLVSHKEANEGQITQESIDEERHNLLSSFIDAE